MSSVPAVALVDLERAVEGRRQVAGGGGGVVLVRVEGEGV